MILKTGQPTEAVADWLREHDHMTLAAINTAMCIQGYSLEQRMAAHRAYSRGDADNPPSDLAPLA